MKTHQRILFIVLACVLSVVGYSQNGDYTKLDKNINDNNLGLEQRLSRNGDTLILKSKEQILRVNFLSYKNQETLSVDVVSHTVRIPLYHFGEGRYTVAVYNGPKIVVLGFNRLLPLPISSDLDFDLEKSILRSSLSDTDLKIRGIEPFSKSRTSGLTEIQEEPFQNQWKPKRALITSNSKDHEFETQVEPKTDKESNQSVSQVSTKSTEDQKAQEKIKYSISGRRGLKGTGKEMETREEYRQRNLRPNGKKYD